MNALDQVFVPVNVTVPAPGVKVPVAVMVPLVDNVPPLVMSKVVPILITTFPANNLPEEPNVNEPPVLMVTEPSVTALWSLLTVTALVMITGIPAVGTTPCVQVDGVFQSPFCVVV